MIIAQFIIISLQAAFPGIIWEEKFMIGREKEIEQLKRLYEKDKAELVAVYGRHRVGKTFLVDEVFKGRITFHHSGLSPVEMAEHAGVRPLKQQLQAFYYSLLYHGMQRTHCPKDWLEAFYMLEVFLRDRDDGSRQLVFLDELPWMDTKKSGFMTGFESFWNGWACHRHNIMVIVCGSATSWIQDKLINNHGGLYNRVTYQMKLEPFSLNECDAFLKDCGIEMSQYDVAQSYMIVGGVPYYLGYFSRGKSLPQIVDDLFFNRNAHLASEYDRLFSSVFSEPAIMKKIVEFLSRRSAGYSRKEIIRNTSAKDGGPLSEKLSALIASDFIIKYVPFGKSEEYYKLTDPFCLFYLRFVKDKGSLSEQFWQQNSSSPAILSWRGYSFENLCFNHIRQIKRTLGILGVSTKESAWNKHDGEDEGTQIDLIIERKDNVVNMCEIKFYGNEFTVDKQYDLVLRNRVSALSKLIGPKCTIQNTLISTFGVKANQYAWTFDNVITLRDLFMPL